MARSSLKKLMLLALTVILIMGFSSVSAFADSNTGSGSNTVTIDVEYFTLGQGFRVAPTQYEFNDGENGAQVVTRFLTEKFGDNAYKSTGTIAGSFYLSKVKDPNIKKGTANDFSKVPKYIMDQAGSGKISGKATADGYLGEFDFSSMSGWTYEVNNTWMMVGMSGYKPKNGDVVRLAFTVWGYGNDWGNSGFGTGDWPTYANLDNLLRELGRSQKLGKTERSAYKTAVAVASDLTSSQASVDSAQEALEKINDIVDVTGVTLDNTNVGDLGIGKGITLNASIAPYNATNSKLTWSSSDKTVAVVDENGTVTGIKPGKAIITVATSDGGKTAECVVNVKKHLPAKVSPTVKATSSKSIKVSWKKIHNADKYKVFISTSKNEKYKRAGTTAKTSMKISKLIPGTKYYFKVLAVNRDGSGKLSKSKTAVTWAVPDFKLRKASARTVSVAWTPVKGAKGYQIANNATASGKYRIQFTGTNGNHKYTSMKKIKGKTYKFKMRTYTIKNGKRIYSKWSDAVMIRM